MTDIFVSRETGGNIDYGERQLPPSGTSATFLLKTFLHVPYVSMGREEIVFAA